MNTRTRLGRLAIAATTAAALAVPLLSQTQAQAAVSLNVNLAAPTRPSTGVGEGFLYGINADGTQPPDQFLLPLNPNAFRGGGHVSRGWIGDNYQNGTGTQAQLNSVATQARRLTRPPFHMEYQVIVSDIYGADGGQPSNTMFPCDNGNCSNWITMVDTVVNTLQATGLTFAYDIWNEPDISAFWTRGINSAQYFQMWDTAFREIRRLAPGARIVGPSFAFTPQSASGQWQAWLAHAKAAGTLPNEITNHNEGDGNDPVTVAQALNNAMTSAGISPLIPLSSNEFQPMDRQSAGVSAWYLARFAQSGYANAMRGNWVCCLTPNLTGILGVNGSSFTTTGNWWVFRDYADLTGSLVTTSGQVNSTAISAAEDSAARRAVAIIGDGNGFTGDVSVTFSGLASVPWLANNGNVNVVVRRIPDQSSLGSPIVVLNQNVSVAGGSVTVPFTFQASHDAFTVYLTPAGSGPPPGFPSGNHRLVIANDGLCLDVSGNTTNPGAAIDQWTCNGQANQQFQFLPGSDGFGPLRAQNSGDDVAVSGDSTAAGVPDVVQQIPNGAANGLWKPVQQSDGSFAFQNKASGLCLDVTRAGSNLGQQLDQWQCKNAPGSNQGFFPR
jgi:hypothetical protein